MLCLRFDKSQILNILASLPMYDWPELRLFTDELWAGLAHYAGLEGALHRGEPHDAIWHDGALLLSQTCGYPFTHEFRDLLKYVATPHYDCEGCEGAHYSSVIFARDLKPIAEFSGAKPAINALDSMSGNLALKLCFKDFLRGREFFQPPLITGGHLNSLAAVRERKADVCAIDAVCVALAKKYRPADLVGLVEIMRSPMVPCLPFVTRAGSVSKLQDSLRQVFQDRQLKEVRSALLLGGISVLPAGAYNVIPQLEASL